MRSEIVTFEIVTRSQEHHNLWIQRQEHTDHHTRLNRCSILSRWSPFITHLSETYQHQWYQIYSNLCNKGSLTHHINLIFSHLTQFVTWLWQMVEWQDLTLPSDPWLQSNGRMQRWGCKSFSHMFQFCYDSPTCHNYDNLTILPFAGLPKVAPPCNRVLHFSPRTCDDNCWNARAASS